MGLEQKCRVQFSGRSEKGDREIGSQKVLLGVMGEVILLHLSESPYPSHTHTHIPMGIPTGISIPTAALELGGPNSGVSHCLSSSPIQQCF